MTEMAVLPYFGKSYREVHMTNEKFIGPLRVRQHPMLGVKVREDGAVLVKKRGRSNSYYWSYGFVKKCRSQRYLFVGVNSHQYAVHRLIAETYKDNPERKPTVDHSNRDTKCNWVWNINWATHKEQIANTTRVVEFVEKYGFRPCDDPSSYQKIRRANNPKYKEWYQRYYNEHKEEIRRKTRDRRNRAKSVA